MLVVIRKQCPFPYHGTEQCLEVIRYLSITVTVGETEANKKIAVIKNNLLPLYYVITIEVALN